MKIISISNLRADMKAVLAELEKTKQPVVIIKHSQPSAVLIEYGQYERFCAWKKKSSK